MEIGKLALVLGAAFTVGVCGVSAAACSSSSGNTGSGSSSGGSSGSSSGGDSGVVCKSNPTLHTATGGSIYCGYAGDAGATLTCPLGQECCIGGSLGGGLYADDTCQTWGSTCDNPAPDASMSPGLQVECEQTADCTVNSSAGDGGTGEGGAGSMVCCLVGTSPAQVAGCPIEDQKAVGGNGTVCEQASACMTGEVQVCLQTSDCPSGQTCTPFRWKIIEMGYCK